MKSCTFGLSCTEMGAFFLAKRKTFASHFKLTVKSHCFLECLWGWEDLGPSVLALATPWRRISDCNVSSLSSK